MTTRQKIPNAIHRSLLRWRDPSGRVVIATPSVALGSLWPKSLTLPTSRGHYGSSDKDADREPAAVAAAGQLVYCIVLNCIVLYYIVLYIDIYMALLTT